MPELKELVNVVAGGASADNKCPFPHFPANPTGTNDWANSSQTLGTNLADASAAGDELYLSHMEETTIATGSSDRPNYTAKYNPHHLLPADATWPDTQLKKWIDHSGIVQSDIGYDVNGYENGIDLPSNNAMRGKWTAEAGRTGDFQVRYAFAAMDAEGSTRQFHDSHKSYSDFAIKVLDKIAAKLDAKERNGDMGCGDKKCPAKKASKPYPTPIEILPRIYGASLRLSQYLYGSPRKWRKPLFTSKFALMYKNRGLSQEDATEQLSPDNFV